MATMLIARLTQSGVAGIESLVRSKSGRICPTPSFLNGLRLFLDESEVYTKVRGPFYTLIDYKSNRR